MDTLEKEAVRSKYVFLVQTLDVRHMLAHLYQYRFINEEEMEFIDGQETSQQRVRTFLKILNECNIKDCFKVFLKVLRESDWEFVADVLEAEYVKLRADPKMQQQLGDWLQTSLTVGDRERTLSLSDVALISRQLGDGWQQLGLQMGFPPGRLQQLQMQHSFDISQAVLNMLTEWIRRQPRQATIQNFVVMCRQTGIDERSYKSVIIENCCSSRKQMTQAII